MATRELHQIEDDLWHDWFAELVAGVELARLDLRHILGTAE